MAKSDGTKNLGVLSNKIYELLLGLESGERAKVLGAVVQLYGDPGIAQSLISASSNSGVSPVANGSSTRQQVTPGNAQQFYAQKSPENKGEMLAVAARYREQHGAGTSHQAEDFAAFFADARQNFDKHNFNRDITNAQRQSGLFNLGTARGQYQLSYYGQQYVDALPDREAVKNLKRPTRRVVTKRKQAKNPKKATAK